MIIVQCHFLYLYTCLVSNRSIQVVAFKLHMFLFFNSLWRLLANFCLLFLDHLLQVKSLHNCWSCLTHLWVCITHIDNLKLILLLDSRYLLVLIRLLFLDYLYFVLLCFAKTCSMLIIPIHLWLLTIISFFKILAGFWMVYRN